MLSPDWAILRAIGPCERPHTIIDVGAHHGWFFHCWLDWCPQGEVYAFEPTAASFKKVEELYGGDPRVHLFQLGLGAKSEALSLNILSESQVSNSFLRPKEDAWESIEYVAGDISKETVEVTTLDQFFMEKDIRGAYLLKIDVQGFELDVLRGATKVLPGIDYVFVEAGIQRLYEGAPSFADVHAELEKRDFHLMTMRAWHRGNHRLVETDMLFRRNDLAPDIDREKMRYYVELR